MVTAVFLRESFDHVVRDKRGTMGVEVLHEFIK